MSASWTANMDDSGLPDQEFWHYETYGNIHGWELGQLHFATENRELNCVIQDGKLIFRALREDAEAFQYTSARLRTNSAFRYGTIRIRAKLPRARGLWSLVTLKPVEPSPYREDAGEIEILSHAATEGEIVHSTIRTGKRQHAFGNPCEGEIAVENAFDEFHDYQVEWTSEFVRVSVDGQVVNGLRNEGMGYKYWPFDREFQLVVGLGVGGIWAGKDGVDDEQLQNEVFEIEEVEYIPYENEEKEEENEKQWVLVWQDNFEDEKLDESKWSFDVDGNRHGWGNNELQAYTTAREENCSIVDGHLRITALREDYFDSVSERDFQYTSARLFTKGQGDWLHGKVEVRARLPKGRGSWPAIWMLPTDWLYGDWPASGEIDIMEHVGYDEGRIHASAHTMSYNHIKNTQKTESVMIDNIDNWHNYVLEWEENQYRVYVDDVHTFTFERELDGGPAEWPFDQRFHLIMNVAVGGNWGGSMGIDEESLPYTMEVDYVRIYELLQLE